MPSDLKDADAAEHGTKCKSPGGIIKSRTKGGRGQRPLRPQLEKWHKGHLTIFCCLGPETNYSKQFKKCLQTNRNQEKEQQKGE